MVLALASPPAHIVFAGVLVRSGVNMRLQGRRDRSSRLARVATPAALVYSSVFSFVQLGLVVYYPGSSHNSVWAFAATACYLPLHLYHVYWAVRGARPPAGLWTLAALTAIVTAALPVGGSNWLSVFAVVAVSAVLVLPWPWSLVAAAFITVAQVPLAYAIDSPVIAAPSYHVFALWWRASALFVPIWLLGAIRQLQASRLALAEEALDAERVRIDGDLRSTVGSALDDISARGERALALIDVDPDAFGREVGDLAAASRRSLGEARQLITSYREPSLAAELEAAARILVAAGIATRVDLPAGGLPAGAERDVFHALRAATSRVLHDDRVDACVISVTARGDRAEVEIHVVDALGTVAR